MPSYSEHMRNFLPPLICLFVILLSGYGFSEAQELNCIVKVNASQIQTSDRRVFSDMEQAFTRFMNDRKWTEDNYSAEERINCTLNININKMESIGSFEATVQVQSVRPVYNSNYESVLLNYADREWQFNYIESQPLEYTDNTFISNLTSMLAYYAYMILGLDYDSFGELGGTPYFQKAFDIVSNAQQFDLPGWGRLKNNRNRYWLAENYTNGQIEGIRKGIYAYHRQAMDIYSEDPTKSRQEIVKVLKAIQKVDEIFPRSIITISFFDAKSDELINVFSKGEMNVRKEAYDILSALDPSKRDEYKSIITSN